MGTLLRERALTVCLAEASRWGEYAPDEHQIDEYLRGCTRNGKNIGAWLASVNVSGNVVNFCAAAQGWAENEALVESESAPPWRAGAKEIMADAQQVRRRALWLPAADIRGGLRAPPPPGSLAIYHRGAPEAFTGHVDRVIRVLDAFSYECVGANELGRRWRVELASFNSHALLGFVVDLAGNGENNVPEDFVETPISSTDRMRIRGALAEFVAEAGRDAVAEGRRNRGG